MNTYSKQPMENRLQAAADTVTQRQKNKQASALIDNRPQTVTQRKLFSNQSQSNNTVIQLGRRHTFSGPATKIRKIGASQMGKKKYDMAHRLSYHRISQIVGEGNQAKIDKLIAAVTIPQRDFGKYKAGDTTYYNKVKKIKNSGQLIKSLNNSPFNLRPGNPSKNRSIGAGFDPNIDDSGYETDQSEALKPFAIKKKQKYRTSTFSYKQNKLWENKVFKEDLFD